MSPQPLNPEKKDFPGRRWLSVTLRSLHLAGVVLVGASLLGAAVARQGPAVVMLLTGIALYGLELWANPKHKGELAGVFIPVKLVGVGGMVVIPEAAGPLFWGLLIASSVVSHAPGKFRHLRVFGA